MGGRWMLFFEKYLSVRASGASEHRGMCGITKSTEVPTSASIDKGIDSRVSLRDGRLRTFGVSETSSRRLLCSHQLVHTDWCASSPSALSPSPSGVSGLYLCRVLLGP